MYLGSRIGFPNFPWLRSRRAVAIGAEFCRVRKNNTVETAKVISLVDDSFGIPHVKYALTFKSKRTFYTDGPRMLALKAFEQTYRDESGA